MTNANGPHRVGVATSIGSTPRPIIFFLLAAMAAGTFTAAIFSVLGTFVVDAFAISRAELGLIVSINTILGGLVSPAIGRAVDRLGGGFSVQLVFLMAALSFALAAAAPGYWLLVVAALVGAVAQALSNPATNKVISDRVPPVERATITGLKQSGVQFALFFGGLLLPSLAEWFGWRAAFLIVASLCALTALAVRRYRRGAARSKPEPGRGRSRVGATSRWLAGYGLLMGISVSAVFFLPLFVEEELGSSVRTAGVAAAVAGITAVVGRVVWAHFAQRGDRYRLALGLMAGLAVVGPLLMMVGDRSLGFVWAGTVVVGASASSWNSVGMLAVINDSGSDTGSASGWVLLGFLLGLGAAPPLFGLTYDVTGSYATMWLLAAAAAALATVVTVAWAVLSGRGRVPAQPA